MAAAGGLAPRMTACCSLVASIHSHRDGDSDLGAEHSRPIAWRSTGGPWPSAAVATCVCPPRLGGCGAEVPPQGGARGLRPPLCSPSAAPDLSVPVQRTRGGGHRGTQAAGLAGGHYRCPLYAFPCFGPPPARRLRPPDQRAMVLRGQQVPGTQRATGATYGPGGSHWVPWSLGWAAANKCLVAFAVKSKRNI